MGLKVKLKKYGHSYVHSRSSFNPALATLILTRMELLSLMILGKMTRLNSSCNYVIDKAGGGHIIQSIRCI